MPLLRETTDLIISGVIVAVDRSEKGSGDLSAVQELQQDLNISIYPILTIHQLIEYLSTENSSGMVLSEERVGQIGEYLSVYGA